MARVSAFSPAVIAPVLAIVSVVSFFALVERKKRHTKEDKVPLIVKGDKPTGQRFMSAAQLFRHERPAINGSGAARTLVSRRRSLSGALVGQRRSARDRRAPPPGQPLPAEIGTARPAPDSA